MPKVTNLYHNAQSLLITISISRLVICMGFFSLFDISFNFEGDTREIGKYPLESIFMVFI